jgi:hypothetical protein
MSVMLLGKSARAGDMAETVAAAAVEIKNPRRVSVPPTAREVV